MGLCCIKKLFKFINGQIYIVLCVTVPFFYGH